MLRVTPSAAEAIREITSAIPAADGIRLARLPGQPLNGSGPTTSIEAQAVSAPEDSDEVLDEQGARLFVEPSLVPDLDDKVLDVERRGPEATFVLGRQR